MKKRILAYLLTICTAASLMTAPVGAAQKGTGFSDVSDRSTVAAVEALRLLGVLDGYSDGSFRPSNQLTRAQFCKMAVYAMNASDQLGQYHTMTVFQDVRSGHWAAAYINMASKGKGIIAGYPDGRFQPDNTVSYGQAVTILMRMLGYEDKDMGGLWPDSYLSEAAVVGLTEGVDSGASEPVTRGQAACLFANLLRCNTKEGGSYAATLGRTVEGAVLVTSTATATDGSETAMQTGDGTVYSMANKASSGVLNGYKGTLILNKQGKVLTFVPEEAAGSSKTVVVASATNTKLTTVTGQTYTIAASTKVYINGSETTWGSGYSWINPGTSLTLNLGASGSVDYIFAGAVNEATSAVIVYNRGSAAGFSDLAGTTRYSIYKNGVEASVADMRPYDVATYSPATNAIRVCDNRITGIYESCSPNASSPSAITVMGKEFKVLPSAADTISRLTVGKAITLLLTEDNQVAGAVEAGTSGAAGNAVGIIKSLSTTSATVDLLCGISGITGSVSLTENEVSRLKNQLVRVASDRRGTIGITALTGGVTGDLDVSTRRLGSKSLSANAVIFESTSTGVQPLSYDQIARATIPAGAVTYARTDWAGRIDLLVLRSITGSEYEFGRLSYTAAYDEATGEGSSTHHRAQVSIITGNGTSLGPYAAANFTVEDDRELVDGMYVGVRVERYGRYIESLQVLNKIGGVTNGSWNGPTSVTAAGRTYEVAQGVLCYNKTLKSWVSLEEAHAFSNSSDLYVDNTGMVRIIEVS